MKSGKSQRSAGSASGKTGFNVQSSPALIVVFFLPGKKSKKREPDDLKKEVELYISQVVPRMPKEHVFYEQKENKDSLKQIQFMFKHSEYFRGLMEGSKFEDLARDLLQHDVRPVNMQYFNKAGITSKLSNPFFNLKK